MMKTDIVRLINFNMNGSHLAVNSFRYWVITFLLFSSFFIYSNFFYVDLFNRCFVTLLPSINFSNGKVIESIKVLKSAANDEYKSFCSKVNMIDPNVFCGGFEGGCYSMETPGRIYVDTSSHTLALIASVIVHETCHATQHQQKRPLQEPECYQQGYKVLNNLILR